MNTAAAELSPSWTWSVTSSTPTTPMQLHLPPIPTSPLHQLHYQRMIRKLSPCVGPLWPLQQCVASHAAGDIFTTAIEQSLLAECLFCQWIGPIGLSHIPIYTPHYYRFWLDWEPGVSLIQMQVFTCKIMPSPVQLNGCIYWFGWDTMHLGFLHWSFFEKKIVGYTGNSF